MKLTCTIALQSTHCRMNKCYLHGCRVNRPLSTRPPCEQVLIYPASLLHLVAVFNKPCTTILRYPIFSTRYSVICKVYTRYHGTSGIEHGLYACTVDNPLAKARGLSLRTGAQTMLYLSLIHPATGSIASAKMDTPP